MAIKTPNDSLILLPKDVLAKIKDAKAEDLKILIYAFAQPDSPLSDMARETGLTIAQAEMAMSFWRGAGIIEEAEAPKKQVTSNVDSMYRNYDSESIKNAMENDEFKMLCNVASNRLEKMLTKNDYSSLLYLYDFVRIPAPVLCGVIELCCSMDKKSLQYIFKKALALYDEGIDTYDKFEQYLAYRDMINSNIGKIRRLFGMGERALTPKEQKLFDCWFGEWAFSFEMVELAYQKTIDNTGKINTNYMNGILKRWQEGGFENIEDVEKGDKGPETQSNSSFTADEFIEAALSRGFDD